MQVTQLTADNAMAHCPAVKKQTDADLQREYDYLMAEKLAKKMLDQGIISEAECTKLLEKCRDYFSPFLADLA